MSIIKNGINLPGDGEEKCCWCFPIKCGVHVIGVFGFIFGVVNCITMGLGTMAAGAVVNGAGDLGAAIKAAADA